jgi:DMSO/TMAO reductase YedYZ molybdopterin-dependent catalytic subunit
MRRRWFLPIVVALVVLPRAADGQNVLTVDGEVRTVLTLSLDDLRAMSHQRVEVENQGARVIYEGIPLMEILRRAGVAIGRTLLEGRALVSMVYVTAVDGFQAAFALAELEAGSSSQRAFLVDTQDGRALPPADGPLRVIAPGDKDPARWVRHVRGITVVNAPIVKPR